jgi:hypothetical protein
MLPSYKIQENKETQDFFAKVSQVWPSATAKLHSPDDRDGSECRINLAEGLLIRKGWKGWNFSVGFPDHLVGMRQRFSDQLEAACPTPNKMNVPKTKSIQNWIDYRARCINWLEAKLAEVTPDFEAKKAIVLELIEMAAQIDKKAGYPTIKVPFEEIKEKHFSFDTPLGALRIGVTIDHRKKEIYFSKKLYISLYDKDMINTIKSFQNE